MTVFSSPEYSVFQNAQEQRGMEIIEKENEVERDSVMNLCFSLDCQAMVNPVKQQNLSIDVGCYIDAAQLSWNNELHSLTEAIWIYQNATS